MKCYAHGMVTHIPRVKMRVREDSNMSDACVLQDSGSPFSGSVKGVCSCKEHKAASEILRALGADYLDVKFFDWFFYDIDHVMRLLYISINIS